MAAGLQGARVGLRIEIARTIIEQMATMLPTPGIAGRILGRAAAE